MLVSVSHMRIFLLTEMWLPVELTLVGTTRYVCTHNLRYPGAVGSVKQVKSVRDCMEMQTLNAPHALAKHCSDAVRYFSEMLQGMVHHVICNNFFYWSVIDHSKYDHIGP